jgi:predicted GNAT superfamily acetyltransferase
MRDTIMNGLEKNVEAGGRKFLLRVESSHDAGDYRKYEDVRNEVWGFPEDHFSATRNMMCENFLHEGGSLYVGAFAEDERGDYPLDGDHLAAFCYGYVGIRNKHEGFRSSGNLRFYSQFAAVRERYRGSGLGILIKEFQREKVLGLLGIGETICTFDPLTGVNAYRNVHHFGMEVLEYRVATYGEYGGLLNRTDVPTDRFLMSWDLRKEAGQDPGNPVSAWADSPHVVPAGIREVAGKSGRSDLEVVGEETMVPDSDLVIVRIPRDFYQMLRETDVEDPEVRRIPLDWRLRTRQAFSDLLPKGYRVSDFRRGGGELPWSGYLLKRETK